MEELEFYFLAKDRSLGCINEYLDKYAPERVPLSKNYVYPEFSDEPKIQFLNPNELMLKLVSEGSGSYSLYWQVYNSRLSQVMVIFLEDAGLIFTKKHGDEVVAYCPWHDDRNASLAINIRTGKYHCFNGCIKGRDGLKRLLEKLDPDRNLYQILIDRFPELYIRKYIDATPIPVDVVKYDVTQLPLAVDNPYLITRGIEAVVSTHT